MNPLLLFETTHHALFAEQLAQEHGLAVDPVPAPPEAGAGCDIALEFFPGEEERISEVLRSGNVEFRIWTRG